MIKFVLFWSFGKYNILQVTNTVLGNYVTGQKCITFSSETNWFYTRRKKTEVVEPPHFPTIVHRRCENTNALY